MFVRYCTLTCRCRKWQGEGRVQQIMGSTSYVLLTDENISTLKNLKTNINRSLNFRLYIVVRIPSAVRLLLRPPAEHRPRSRVQTTGMIGAEWRTASILTRQAAGRLVCCVIVRRLPGEPQDDRSQLIVAREIPRDIVYSYL